MNNKKVKLSLFSLKKLGLVVLNIILIILILFPKQADASSKEYNIYKKIHLGMTATEVSKVLYGKKYKSHIKKENGIITLKDSFSRREIQKHYKLYDFAFFPFDAKDNSWYSHRMNFVLKTKLNGKILFVAEKDFAMDHPSERRLHKGKTVKEGMTYKQVDKVIYGKGLGNFVTHFTSDYSELGENEYHSKMTYSPKRSVLQYFYRSYDGKKLYHTYFLFDDKKKQYVFKNYY